MVGNNETEALRRTQRWHRCSRGGHNDGTGSGEVDDGAGSRENFGSLTT
jgi:hypothetical protein